MIRESHGDLLRADAEALVNTVNTLGVMGKGIALQFKKAYPAMFEEYRKRAQAGNVTLGKVHVWETGQVTHPRYIINFPTKGHWKSSSKLVDIRAGLDDLVGVVRDLDITSIALPPLGCGNGGLEWRVVEPLIRSAFASLPAVDVLLYAPDGAPKHGSTEASHHSPAMTTGRAALIVLISRYTDQALDAPGLSAVQSLMYFLQEAGEPLQLTYEWNRHGPSANNLRRVLTTVEGHFIRGYRDEVVSVRGVDALAVLPGAVGAAESFLVDQSATVERIERVLDLVDGYESAYGLDLLASLHWLSTHSPHPAVEDWIATLKARSPSTERMFTDRHVTSALNTLRTRGWIRDLANV